MATSIDRRRVFVIGVGMTKFEKPGSKDWDYPDVCVWCAFVSLAAHMQKCAERCPGGDINLCVLCCVL